MKLSPLQQARRFFETELKTTSFDKIEGVNMVYPDIFSKRRNMLGFWYNRELYTIEIQDEKTILEFMEAA